MEFDKVKKAIENNQIYKMILAHKMISIISFIVVICMISGPLWDYIDGVITIGTLLVVIFNFYLNEQQRELELQQISIYFNDRKINFDIARKDITRQELQGVLGILRKDMTKNYHIEYLTQLNYIDEIYKVQRAENDELKIILTENELEQFKDDIYEN